MGTSTRSTRRHRLTIAALVLLVLGGGVWWLMRPKIDPRLVGEWINIDATAFSPYRCFNADGTESHIVDAADIFPYSYGHWSVAGDTVTFTPEGRIHLTGFDNLYRRTWVFWRRLRGTAPPPEVERYRIVEVTPTSLQLKADSPAPLERYRRKSDTDVLPPPIPVGATVR